MSVDGYRELIDRVHRLHRPARAARVGCADREQGRRSADAPCRASRLALSARCGRPYAGHYPAHSGEALTHLRQLYAKGAQYLCFPWTAHWWLEHYHELASHLSASHELILSQHGTCVIYALRESAAFDAFALPREIDRRDGI